MGRLRRLFSLQRFIERPHFVPGDTCESFLARIRIRKLLQYSRLAAVILMFAGPVAILFYEQPGGTWLGLTLLACGVVALLLIPLVARWSLLQQRSEWVSLLMTLYFLGPCAAPVLCGPIQDQGRTFVILGLAVSTYCLSRQSFLVNYACVAAAWIATWILNGVPFGTDDILYFFLAVPVVGYLICSLQTDALVSLFDLHRLALDQQQTLERTLEQLTLEIDRRQDEERLRAESHEQLQEQQQKLLHVSRLSALGEMTAGVAHEIRQPLHALSMYAGVLSTLAGEPQPDLAKLRSVSEKVGEIVQHTGELLRSLQSFASRGSQQMSPVSIEEVIRDAVLLTEPEWRRQRVQIRIDQEEPVAFVRGDDVQLQQVLVNLLRNSCEAMGTSPVDDRQIHVQLRVQNGHVEIHVADTGCGFAAEEKAHLFETFFTTKEDGLGMGLSISRRIVEEHCGTLELVTGDQTGATFLIRLPVLEPGRPDTIHGGSSSLSD